MKNITVFRRSIAVAMVTLVSMGVIAGCSDEVSVVLTPGLVGLTPPKNSFYRFEVSPAQPPDVVPGKFTVTVDSIYPSFKGKTNVAHFTGGVSDTVLPIDMYLAYATNGDVYEYSGSDSTWYTHPYVSTGIVERANPVDTTIAVGGTVVGRIINTDRNEFLGITNVDSLLMFVDKRESRRYDMSSSIVFTDLTNSTVYTFVPKIGFFWKLVYKVVQGQTSTASASSSEFTFSLYDYGFK